MDVLSHIRLKTCTTAAEAPAFPPPSAFLDAFLRIAFQSTGAAVAAASDKGTVELIASAFVGIITVAAIVAAMNEHPAHAGIQGDGSMVKKMVTMQGLWDAMNAAATSATAAAQSEFVQYVNDLYNTCEGMRLPRQVPTPDLGFWGAVEQLDKFHYVVSYDLLRSPISDT